jgi:hypothetical protein
MSMKTQPEGIIRKQRGEPKFDDSGKKLPPDQYDIYLRDNKFGKDAIGWTERLPKGKWGAHPAASTDAGEIPPFGDHTAAVEFLLQVFHGQAKTSENGSAEETEAILADPDAVAAINEALAEEGTDLVLDPPVPVSGAGEPASAASGPSSSELDPDDDDIPTPKLDALLHLDQGLFAGPSEQVAVHDRETGELLGEARFPAEASQAGPAPEAGSTGGPDGVPFSSAEAPAEPWEYTGPEGVAEGDSAPAAVAHAKQVLDADPEDMS